MYTGLWKAKHSFSWAQQAQLQQFVSYPISDKLSRQWEVPYEDKARQVRLRKIANLKKVFIGAIGSCGNNYLHGLLNSHSEIISIPFQYRPVDIFLKCKNHSKEKLTEDVVGGFSPMFNSESDIF